VAADSSMRVGELRALTAAALGVPAPDLDLSWSGAPLSSNTATLGSLGIPNGGSVDAVLSGTAPVSPYIVSVSLPPSMHSLHGPTLTLPASSPTTIDQLKGLIEGVTGVGAASIGLSFGGSDLAAGSQTLGAAGISSGSTVVLSNLSAASTIEHVVVNVPANLVSTYGQTITVAADSSMTVGELKELIATALGVLPSDLSFSSGGESISSDTIYFGSNPEYDPFQHSIAFYAGLPHLVLFDFLNTENHTMIAPGDAIIWARHPNCTTHVAYEVLDANYTCTFLFPTYTSDDLYLCVQRDPLSPNQTLSEPHPHIRATILHMPPSAPPSPPPPSPPPLPPSMPPYPPNTGFGGIATAAFTVAQGVGLPSDGALLAVRTRIMTTLGLNASDIVVRARHPDASSRRMLANEAFEDIYNLSATLDQTVNITECFTVYNASQYSDVAIVEFVFTGTSQEEYALFVSAVNADTLDVNISTAYVECVSPVLVSVQGGVPPSPPPPETDDSQPMWVVCSIVICVIFFVAFMLYIFYYSFCNVEWLRYARLKRHGGRDDLLVSSPADVGRLASADSGTFKWVFEWDRDRL
jgi:hypothetical protein